MCLKKNNKNTDRLPKIDRGYSSSTENKLKITNSYSYKNSDVTLFNDRIRKQQKLLYQNKLAKINIIDTSIDNKDNEIEKIVLEETNRQQI